MFAQSLGADAEVALESTGGAVAIARILEVHVARVVVVNTRKSCASSSSPPEPSAARASRHLGRQQASAKAELELARQAETAYRRLVTDWQPKGAET